MPQEGGVHFINVYRDWIDNVGRKPPSSGLQSKNRIVMPLAFAYTVIFARAW